MTSIRKILTTACILCSFPLVHFSQTPILGNAAELPFYLEIQDITQDELPGLHSFAFAEWEGLWVIIGGRVNGLHGFFPFTAFPENGMNAEIRVINPETGDMFSFPIEQLNIPFRDPLRSTNPQSVQRGEWLYIAGGYGKNTATDEFITFPVLTAVYLPDLIAQVLSGHNPEAAFKQIEAEPMRVCGGEMEWLDGYFYLVGGHDFSGSYSQTPTPLFSQAYTYEIRKFRIVNEGAILGIEDYEVWHDEQNLRRRDFSMAPVIRPDGTPSLGLYGGVFRPDIDLPYYHPIYISPDDIFEIDADYEQVFSQYTCPVVPIFDSTDQSMYSIFFGGLSVHYFDQGEQEVKYDELVPFIHDISTLKRAANGTSEEYLMPARFDALLGSNMQFVLNKSAAHYENEVVKLHALDGPTVVGYLFGGIEAQIPNITPSSASNRMFQVMVTPKNMVNTETLTAEKGHGFRIFPNPYHWGATLRILGDSAPQQIRLYRLDGSLIGSFGADHKALEHRLNLLPVGLYRLSIDGETYALAKGF